MALLKSPSFLFDASYLKECPLPLHHIGLAVPKPESAAAFLSAVGYQVGPVVHDPLQQVNLQFCTHALMPAVELVFSDGTEGPLRQWLQDDQPRMYHVCYQTSDVPSTLADWRLRGIRAVCVNAPKPAVLFNGQLVSFYMVKGFGLVELLHAGKTA